MTLGGQRPSSDNSDEIHAALAGCSEQTNGSQPPAHGKTRFGFKANDFVVYPAHGVGQIVTIEEQTITGACLEFIVVNFAKNKMTLRVPTGKMANAGMRRLSDPAAIVQVRRTLSRAPYKARGNWSRLVQDYESKMNSGDIIALAEVIRDLYRPAVGPDQNYSERQLYAAALDRLSGEVALIEHITVEEAARELESIVKAGAERKAQCAGKALENDNDPGAAHAKL
jgi:CarD family transcriptional regulator